jgi:hypothetical protein
VLTLPAELWTAFTDANQLESAVLNLAINARDAMLDGGRLTIETTNVHLEEAYTSGQEDVAPGDYVVISVSDTGKGMPADVLAKAIDPFFTTKPFVSSGSRALGSDGRTSITGRKQMGGGLPPAALRCCDTTTSFLNEGAAVGAVGRGGRPCPLKSKSKSDHSCGPTHVTARQYARIAHGWIEGAVMDSSAYSTHSMRRTKEAQIYRKTGNLRAVQLLLGHTKIESTVRYLGIEVDDALTLSEQTFGGRFFVRREFVSAPRSGRARGTARAIRWLTKRGGARSEPP